MRRKAKRRSNIRGRWVRPVAGVIILLLAAVVAVSGAVWKASSRILLPRGQQVSDYHRSFLEAPGSYGLEITPFEVPADDGYTLAAYLISPGQNLGKAIKFRRFRERIHNVGAISAPLPGESRGTILMLHGHRGIKENHFPIAERFCAAGFHCIVFDSASNGASDGRYCTFGVREKYDAISVVDTAIAHFGAEKIGRLGVFGYSRGGAEAIQTTALEKRIGACVAVASFSGLERLLKEIVAREFGAEAVRFAPLVGLVCQYRAGFHPSEVTPAEVATTVDCPLMVVHGTGDTYIPIAHGRAIYDAATTPMKTWRPVVGGEHHNVLAKGGDTLYHDIVVFFVKSLSRHH